MKILSWLFKSKKNVLTESPTVEERVENGKRILKFKIPVGNLTREQAEQSLKEVMTQYNSKVDFNDNTGEIIIDGKENKPISKDFWIPVSEKPIFNNETDNIISLEKERDEEIQFLIDTLKLNDFEVEVKSNHILNNILTILSKIKYEEHLMIQNRLETNKNQQL